MAKIGILTIHGIGEQKPNFDHELRSRLPGRLNASARPDVVFESIFYQDLIQPNQNLYWAAADLAGGLFPKPWRKLWGLVRRFLLSGFGDAATYQHRPRDVDSAYRAIHNRTLDAINNLRGQLDNADSPVVIIGHSLGCHIISNYIWDAQRGLGIWDGTTPDNFQKLGTTAYFFSAGCNIPVFVAGLSVIEPIQAPNADFKWMNYYDKDDVLGWPMEKLSPPYGLLVDDVQIRASGFLSWSPLSHTEYWKSGSFLNPVAGKIHDLHAQL